jgi:hypothetical protein
VAMFASASVSNAELVKTGDFIYDTAQDLTFYDVNPGNMNWAGANAWALGLVAGGVDDWRLPSDSVSFTGELGSVTLVNAFDGNVPFTHSTFTNSNGDLFWSSELGSNNHLQIGNDDGFVNEDKPDTDLRGVIAVRSGAIPVATSTLEITSITSVGVNLFELKIEGEALTTYQLSSSPTLAFPGTLLSLQPGGIQVGVINTALDAVTTTDGGLATVRVTLADLANFVQAVTGGIPDA